MIQLIKKMFCKHLVTDSASCPFTGNTYVSCAKCGAQLSATKTV